MRLGIETRFVRCDACGGEGVRLYGHPNDPDPRYGGPCPYCEDGVAEVEVEPIEEEDLP